MAFFGLTALGSDNPFADEKLDRLTSKSVEEFHQARVLQQLATRHLLCLLAPSTAFGGEKLISTSRSENRLRDGSLPLRSLVLEGWLTRPVQSIAACAGMEDSAADE